MKRPVVIAAVFGTFAAVLVFFYLNSLQLAYRRGNQKVKVFVAKQYITQGTMIDVSMLQEERVPKEYIQPKAVQHPKELFSADGNSLYMAVAPIEQGEQVVATKLSALGGETGLAAIVPGAKRAYTLVLERDIVAGIIKPGSRIDIIGIFDYQSKGGEGGEIAKTVLEDVLVIAAGGTVMGMSKASSQDKTAALREPAEPGGASVPVTLAVTPKEAELLALATEKGTIKVALRPIGDQSRVSSEEMNGTTIKDLINENVSSSSRISRGANTPNQSYIIEMQKRQKEVLELLRRYQK